MTTAAYIEYMATYVCRFEVLEPIRVVLFTVGAPERIANVNSVSVHEHHSLLYCHRILAPISKTRMEIYRC